MLRDYLLYGRGIEGLQAEGYSRGMVSVGLGSADYPPECRP